MDNPSDEQVTSRLHEILKGADLSQFTRKDVRKQLENEFHCDFSNAKWKKKIKEQIEEFVRQQQEQQGSDASQQEGTPDVPEPTQNRKKRKLNNGSAAPTNSYGNKPLFIKNEKEDSHYMKLPICGAPKRLTITRFKGKVYIGFREYYEQGGEEKPTKKGVNLTPEQWEYITNNIDAINAQLKRSHR